MFYLFLLVNSEWCRLFKKYNFKDLYVCIWILDNKGDNLNVYLFTLISNEHCSLTIYFLISSYTYIKTIRNYNSYKEIKQIPMLEREW